MAIPEDFVELVNNSSPIEDVIGQYVRLQRRGNVHMGLCPFHSEKSPSFTVYDNAKGFYCYGCGIGGSVFTFIQKAENLEFIDAIKFLAERAGLEVPNDGKKGISKTKFYEINRETANFYYKKLISGNNKNGLYYLIQRGVNPATVKMYGLGFAPDEWDGLYKHLKSIGIAENDMLSAGLIRENRNGGYFDFFRNRVIFPIIDLRGNVIGFGGRTIEKDSNVPKYINSPDTPVFNKKDNLFSLNLAKKSETDILILCEGYMDVVQLYQAGFTNAVASLGTALTPSQARIMSNYAKTVITAYDSDNAGQKAIGKSINILSAAGLTLKTLKLGDVKDPDEYIKKYGATKFKILLEHSGDAVMFELERCKEGLNLDDPAGRSQLLRRCIKVLTGITNNEQRMTYSSVVASICGVMQDAVYNAVNMQIKQKKYAEKKEEWQREVQNTISNRTNDENPKTKAAEINIISYLLKFPETQVSISPGLFLSPCYRKIFELITIHKFDFQNILGIYEYLNIEEHSKLQKILLEINTISQNEITLNDSINFLSKQVNTIDRELTDDDLIALTIPLNG